MNRIKRNERYKRKNRFLSIKMIIAIKNQISCNDCKQWGDEKYAIA